jgi:hypothetical protein
MMMDLWLQSLLLLRGSLEVIVEKRLITFMTPRLHRIRNGASVDRVLLDIDLLNKIVRFTQRETTEIVPTGDLHQVRCS